MKSALLHILFPKHALRTLLVLVIVLAGGLGSLVALATTVAPLSLSETVRQADAIVVGTITGHQSRWGDASQRWMQTDYTLAVEDVVYPSEQGVPIRQTIILTYWGGTIGGETQAVADVRLPVDGERLVMMLHSRWAQQGPIAPTVGFDHGFFSVAGDTASGKLVVHDAADRPLALTSNGQMVQGDATAAIANGATVADITAFTGWLRANIGSIKAAPAKSKPTVDPNDPRIMKIFAKSPELAGLDVPDNSRASSNAVAPAHDPATEAGVGVPAAMSATETNASLAAGASDAIAVRAEGLPVAPQYSSSFRAHLPIVVNQFPSSFGSWYLEDQYQMSKWNYYAGVFRVYTTPTGTYGWPNGRFDLAGWPSDADRQRVYGSSWYCGSGCITLGVTFLQYGVSITGPFIAEADIALNPAVGWTLNDEWVFDGAPAYGFRQIMIHELGHMHGLNHNFAYLALMNYLNPGNYSYSSLPFMDDAQGIRAEYPSSAVSLTDLAVYLYSENGPCYDGTSFYNCVSEATYPSSVNAGGSLTVNNFHVENVGTTTISTPAIEWYLTAWRNFSSSYYLGQSTYSSLPPFTYFTPSSVGRTFTVPTSVPAGNYYLAAYIRNDAGAGQGSFPFSNNYAFSRQQISVASLLLPGAPIIGAATADNASARVAFTPGAIGSGTLANYTAMCGTISATGTASPIMVRGLTNGTSYTCKVRTASTAGIGPWSALSNAVTPTSSQASRRYDFNGDGKADILWHNTTTGGNQVWFMNGVTKTGALNTNASAIGWVAAGADDFNGDGKADILWRDAAGQNSIWLMNGATRISGAAIPSATAPWAVAGTGDFNGDGKADILWRNTTTGGNQIWFMNGMARSSAANTAAAATSLSVAGVADFNGDGKTDILWRNAAGQSQVWLMNGATRVSGAAVSPVMAAPWAIAGTGDFNGDGKADILWRHTATGSNQIWFMNGMAKTSAANTTALAVGWFAAEVADFSGDGKADILWRNAAGQNQVWLMNGATRVSGAAVSPNMGATWIVVPALAPAAPPAPVCSLTASPLAMVLGGSTTLTASCPGATNFNWTSSSAGHGLAAANTASVIATPTSTGAKTYTVTGTNAGGSGTASVTVNVIALPKSDCTSITPTTTTIAPGTATSFTATCNNSPAAAGYSWKVQYGTTTPTMVTGCTGASCTVPGAKFGTAGTYYVTVTNNNGQGAGAAATATVIVSNSVPIACPQQLTTIPLNYATPGATRHVTMNRGQAIAFAFTTDSYVRTGMIQTIWSMIAQPVPRYMVVSEKKCDFSYAPLDNSTGCAATSYTTTSINYITTGTPQALRCQLKPNTTYYANIRNEDARPAYRGIDTCTAGQSCGFAATLY